MVVTHRSFSFDGDGGYSPLPSLGSQLLWRTSPYIQCFLTPFQKGLELSFKAKVP